jgi:hypothetical protein
MAGGIKLGENTYVSTGLLITCIVAALAIGGLFVKVEFLGEKVEKVDEKVGVVQSDIGKVKDDVATIKGWLKKDIACGDCSKLAMSCDNCE